MEVAVLGPLRVRVGTEWASIDSSRQRTILALLTAHRPRPVSADELLDTVWHGHPPGGGVKTLRYHVSKLRDLLDPERSRRGRGPIRTLPSGYALDLPGEAVDAERFESLAREGRRRLVNGSLIAARGMLDEALELWRGDAWAEFRFDEFALPMIRRLDELRLAAVEDRIETRLRLGERTGVVAELHGLTSRHPFRPRLWTQLVSAHVGVGDRAGALRAADRARTNLGGELDLEIEDLLGEPGRTVGRSPTGTDVVGRARDAIPVRTSSFVGREEELARLRSLSHRQRLVTVVGQGGVGKSTLAAEAARLLVAEGRSVSYVDLTSVGDPEAVVVHIARCLGVPPELGRSTADAVLDHLGSNAHVLVLDGCEHLGAAPGCAVGELLTRAPGLRVVATSRSPLHVDGEHLVWLEPFEVPAGGEPASLADCAAVRLVVDRARARRDVEWDEEILASLAEVCRRVDGLPLALELAAARLAVLSVDELLDGLARSAELLTDDRRPLERHRSLRATFEWSHALLSPPAREVLASVSVWRGRFDLPAIEAVCEATDRAGLLGAVEELVDFSFLSRDDAGFRTLGLVREFARRQLSTSGREPGVRARHAEHLATISARRSGSGSVDPPTDPEVHRSESANRLDAFDWAIEHGRADLAVSLAAGVALDWYVQPLHERTLRRLTSDVERVDPSSPALAESLRELGLVLPWAGCIADARAVAVRLERLARRLDDRSVDVDALWVRAAIATVEGDVVASRELFARAIELLPAATDPRRAIFAFDLAIRELRSGRPERAAELGEDLERRAAVTREGITRARAWLLRGAQAYFAGDLDQALESILASLTNMQEQSQSGPRADPLHLLCEVAAVAGRWDLAERGARDLESLIAETGEIVALPVVAFARAGVGLADAAVVRAAAQVAEGLDIMRRTGSPLFLGTAVLVGAQVASARGRGEHVQHLLDERRRWITTRGLDDPVPVARLVEWERARAGPSSSSPPSLEGWEALVDHLTWVVS